MNALHSFDINGYSNGVYAPNVRGIGVSFNQSTDHMHTSPHLKTNDVFVKSKNININSLTNFDTLFLKFNIQTKE